MENLEKIEDYISMNMEKEIKQTVNKPKVEGYLIEKLELYHNSEVQTVYVGIISQSSYYSPQSSYTFSEEDEEYVEVLAHFFFLKSLYEDQRAKKIRKAKLDFDRLLARL